MNYEDLLSWVNDWANKEIVNGENIKELLTYKGISFWWFVNETLFYQLLRKISFINNSKIIHQNQKKRNILLFFTKNISPHVLLAYYMFSSLFFKLIDGLLFRKKTFRNSKKIMIIYTGARPVLKEPNYYAPIINRFKKKKGNYHFVTAYASFNKPNFALNAIIDRLRYQREIPHKLLEAYWSFDVWNAEREGRKHLSKIWENIRENKGFKESFGHKNKNMRLLTKDILNDYFFGFRLGRNLRDIEMAKRMIDHEKPDIIIVGSEYTNFERAVCIAAKLKGTPTLAIQHGTMHPYHPGYIYLKEDISSEGSVESPYCPITDKIAVYGPYAKKILTEISSYPNDSVVITGQPRYDILSKAEEIFNKEKTFEKLNLDKNKKVILWATYSHGLTKEENEKYFYVVYSAVKELYDDVQLIVKPHPCECYDYKNISSMREKISKEIGFNPIIVDPFYNTFELLHTCDLMITGYSTTGLEAMILDKNVIIMNLIDEQHIIPYVESGAALGVYKEEDLIINIKNTLYDKEIKEKLKKAREKFVYEHAYLQDGKATERVCDLIEDMIKNEKCILK